MNTTQDHPAPDRLHSFAQGDLPDNEADLIDRHLEDCADCRGILTQAPPGGASSAPAAGRSVLGDPDEARVEADGLPPGLAEHPGYRVVKPLGRGGMGSVWLAKNLPLDRLEVLKVSLPESSRREELLRRFGREVKALAKLSHPNIATAYGAFRAGEVLVLAMEYVEGVDLERYVRKKGPLQVKDACGIVRKAAVGLHHAHRAGQVHRDVKPSNLMLTPKGQVKILDFGLAKVTDIDGGSNRITQITDPNAIMGTPGFMAPEQARDAGRADARADVYSLGCTLYYLLTGHAPFERQSALEVIMAHAHDEPPPLRRHRDGLTDELEGLVAQSLRKSPGERPKSAAEVARRLEPFYRGGNPPAAATDSVSQRTPPRAEAAVAPETSPRVERPVRRGHALRLVAGVTAGLLAGVFATALILRPSTRGGSVEIISEVAGLKVRIDGESAEELPGGEGLRVETGDGVRSVRLLPPDGRPRPWPGAARQAAEELLKTSQDWEFSGPLGVNAEGYVTWYLHIESVRGGHFSGVANRNKHLAMAGTGIDLEGFVRGRSIFFAFYAPSEPKRTGNQAHHHGEVSRGHFVISGLGAVMEQNRSVLHRQSIMRPISE